MTVDNEKLIRDLVALHEMTVRHALRGYDDYPVIPQSVHTYTSMFMDKLTVLVGKL